jgi:exonuclease III
MPAFSLVTLNCFGVQTPTTRPRLCALTQELNHDPHDVVCLQEVQAHGYCFSQQRPIPGARPGYLSDHVGIALRISWGSAAVHRQIGSATGVIAS